MNPADTALFARRARLQEIREKLTSNVNELMDELFAMQRVNDYGEELGPELASIPRSFAEARLTALKCAITSVHAALDEASTIVHALESVRADRTIDRDRVAGTLRAQLIECAEDRYPSWPHGRTCRLG